MRAFRLALFVAVFIAAGPAFAAECDLSSGVCPPQDSVAQRLSVPLPDLRPEINKLETELNTLKLRPNLSVEQGARLRQLPSILLEMKKAQAAVQTAASSASKSEQAAANSAAAAVRALAETQRNNVESKESARAAAVSAQSTNELVSTILKWLAGILVLSVVLLGVVVSLRQSLVSFKNHVLQELLTLSGKIRNVEDRHLVRISKIESGPHRTFSSAEIQALPPGTSFSYFVLVDEQLARYEMCVVDKAEKGTDVLVVCEQISAGVPSRMLHKTLCERIEKNGSMHPFVALAA